MGSCKIPCFDCPQKNKRIYEKGSNKPLPAHKKCDCFYSNLATKQLGSISKREPAPDVWLKLYGKLPNYFITKQEAIENYGWKPGHNTLAGKAPGKMIGGDIYRNDKYILPEKPGRIWYECDIDYRSGGRSSSRLYYSNDGILLYSPDHLFGNVTLYEII